MANYNTELSLLLMIEQEDASSTTRGTTVGGVANVANFVASGGAADGSTIVSTDLGAAYVVVANDIIGRFAKCISAASQNQGLERYVVACVEAPAGTVTLTCDEWPAQVAATDAFELIEGSHIPIGVDTGAAATFADVRRNGPANDAWNGTAAAGGPYLEHIKSTLNTETSLRLVTDFVQVGGVFTAASGANATVGDLAEVWCCPEEMSGALFDCTVAPLQPGPTIGRFEPQPDKRGQRSATAALDFAFRGPGAANPAGRSELSHMLSSPMALQTTATNLTADVGCTTVSLAYDAGTAVDGAMFCTSRGDVFVSTSSATPLVPSPTLRTAETENATVIALRTYWPATQYAHLLAAKQYHGDHVKEMIFGIAPDFSFEGKMGDFLHAKVACSGSDWYRVHKDEAGAEARKWRAKRPGVNPIMLSGGRVVYLGAEMCLESFTLALNQKPARKGCVTAPNHECGWDLVRGTPTGQMVAKASATNIRWIEDHLSIYDNHGTAAANSFLIQCGSKPGYPGVFGFWAQSVQLTNVVVGQGEGVLTLTADFQVLDHDTDTSLMPPWALGIG